MEIKLGDQNIYYQVQYRKSEKLELLISPECHITVVVPVGMAKWEIEKYLGHKKTMILKAYEAYQNRRVIYAKKSQDQEENYLFLGRACRLGDLLQGESLPETKEEMELKIKRFYTEQTKKVLLERIPYYEKIIGVTAKNYKVIESPGTWGTCNSKKELTFNYRLSMAPLASIDYVVIHELCHIFHMNHDRSFWRKVGCYDKNYKEHADFLVYYGGVMTI